MKVSTPDVGGLDLAALDKNPSGVCRGITCKTLKKDQEIINFLRGVQVVAVDAPLSMEKPYRDSEKALLRKGYRPLPLTMSSMELLHMRALRLKGHLSLIETFVQPMRIALVDILARRMGWNRHERDAFLCYLAAKAFVDGSAEVYGRRHPIYMAPRWYVERSVVKILDEVLK